MRVSRNFHKINNTKKRVVVNRGGSWSSKTYSILQLLLKWLTTWELRSWEFIPVGIASVVRQHRVELNKSVIRDWKNIVESEGYNLTKYQHGDGNIRQNKTSLTYTYWDRIVEFLWMDDPEKAKGPRRAILYINESNNVSYNVFTQLLMRTSNTCFIDFNPDDIDIRINEKIEIERAEIKWDVDILVSTFRDNWFLSKTEVDEILSFRKTDPELWKVYGNWEYWKIEWTIFAKWTHWKETDYVPSNAEYLWSWMDFWFTNDPTTLVDIYRYNWEIIVDEMIYERGLTNIDLVNKIKGIEKSTWFKREIVADNAEPKSIKEISLHGINIIPCVKWKWSVNHGIDLMKTYKMLVTKKSIETKKELKKYVWSKDKDGKSLNTPIDAYNHIIDALRYIFGYKLAQKEEKPEPMVYF